MLKISHLKSKIYIYEWFIINKENLIRIDIILENVFSLLN